MKASEQINELATALAKAQATIPAVPKRGKSHTGKYATLDDLIATIRGPLAENGLSFVQLPAKSRDGIGLVTRLMHESGQWIEEMFVMPIPGGRMNEAQAYGSGLTYARRYSLSALVGAVTEEDTDANVTQPQKKAPASNGSEPKAEPEHTIEYHVQHNTAGVLSMIADENKHYVHVNHVKTTLKKLGHSSWTVGDDNAGARLTMYGELAQYAAYRDGGMDGDAALDAVKNDAHQDEVAPAFEEAG